MLKRLTNNFRFGCKEMTLSRFFTLGADWEHKNLYTSCADFMDVKHDPDSMARTFSIIIFPIKDTLETNNT